MILELREYTFKPEHWPQYWSLFTQICLPIRKDDFGRLRGKWINETSQAVRFLHLWEYASLNERAQLRAELSAIPEWKNNFLPEAAKTLSQQHLRIVNQHKPLMPEKSEKVREFISCQCLPGKATEFIHKLSLSEALPLAIWQSEFSNPNEIIILGDEMLKAEFNNISGLLSAWNGLSLRSLHSV